MSLLEKYGFTNYPFPISPVEEAAFWADLEKVKENLNQFFSFAVSIPASTSALLWGWRGAGKTYSMNYFTKIKQIEELLKEKKITLITIRLPISIYIARESYKALYIGIMDGIRSNLKELLTTIPEKIKEKYQLVGRLKRIFKGELKNFTRNETIQEVIGAWLESLVFGRKSNEDKQMNILRLKTRGKVLTEDDIQEITSALFNFLVNSKTIKELTSKPIKIILWIDEWECIRDISTMENRKINDFLRYLIDYVPFYFILLINVTLRPDEESADIPAYFTHQLLDRISQIIEFPPLTKEDAFRYVSERINFNLIDKKKGCYPFTQNAIREAVKIIIATNKPILPRNLNKVFSTILFDAFHGNKERIDVKFVKKEEEKIKVLL